MNTQSASPQTTREKYNLWIKSPLELLCKEEHTDFAILLIALPTLERYLREKSGNGEQVSLRPAFFAEFGKLFPKPQTNTDREAFWKLFRHGLAHQVMLNTSHGVSASLERNGLCLDYDPSSKLFKVNAPAFARKVMNTVESDFPTFEATSGSPNHFFSQVLAGVKAPKTESLSRARPTP